MHPSEIFFKKRVLWRKWFYSRHAGKDYLTLVLDRSADMNSRLKNHWKTLICLQLVSAAIVMFKDILIFLILCFVWCGSLH